MRMPLRAGAGRFGKAQSPVVRVLSLMVFINTLGNGLFLTVSTLFFIRSVGLTPAELGIGLAAGGVCGVLAGLPVGRASDRYGSVRVLQILLIGEAIGVVSYVVVNSFLTFLIAISVISFLDRGAVAVRNALIYESLSPEDRIRGRAYLRAVGNAGTGIGAAIAASAILADTRFAYIVIILADCATFVLAALFLLRLPQSVRKERLQHSPQANAQDSHPLRDYPFVVATILNAVLALQVGVLEVGLPLWVLRDTKAPKAVVSAGLVLNTVMVIVFQMRVSKGAEDPRRAARMCFASGIMFAIACVVFGTAQWTNEVTAIVILLVGVAALTYGELLSSAGGWSLSYSLSNASMPGAYQGVFNSGFAAGILLGPLVIVYTALPFGMYGWVALGAVFLLAGAGFYPLVRWTIAHRPAYDGAQR